MHSHRFCGEGGEREEREKREKRERRKKLILNSKIERRKKKEI